MTIVNFTPLSALAGGLLIGLSASALLLLRGRVMGVSGILGGVLPPVASDWGWRAAFLLGMGCGGGILLTVQPQVVVSPSDRTLLAVAVAGVLVGVGTRLGNGCTSGHGVCGLTRFSTRSLAAVLTFMLTGGIAATLAPSFSALVGG
ncbi:MAG: YeeE/YedE family protein [Myxococcales bacterium]|nr:YeeE/YedE family protein [Myxococcales bacterium]